MIKEGANKVKFKIDDYQFQHFEEESSDKNPVDYNFQEFDKKKFLGKNHAKKISLEKKMAVDKKFRIAPIVLEHRGLLEQEKKEIEERIKEEVHKRVERVKLKAKEEGFKEGIEQGREEIFNQTKLATEEKIHHLTEMISDVLSTKLDLIQKQKQHIYEITRNLTKWIILRELQEDGAYITRLLERIIKEIETKDRLLIQVNQQQFEQMPDVLETIQKKLGAMESVRVEVDYDISKQGLVVESENGIINGTLEEQLNSLDKLFESVGLPPALNKQLNFPDQTREEGLNEEAIPEEAIAQSFEGAQESRDESLSENDDKDNSDEGPEDE